ncbi:hypothetical protein BO71DRAFT_404437 [Aspergillus ellipticus CBS 707.79]|uniref:Uncharacterized protein n=1 Tax=Aspergillus ellipticus CBS 707.79 TaxID=1448320 RepID=A0A319CQZ5_9EURO|nr:hypothetical protein BO71DRAFT_404437 [Aspergillus ellipticus CBS 707.79]
MSGPPVRALVLRTWCAIVLCLGLLALLFHRLLQDDLTLVMDQFDKHPHPHHHRPNALVLAKTRAEDVSWAYTLQQYVWAIHPSPDDPRTAHYLTTHCQP